jgi:hypothetical protein
MARITISYRREDSGLIVGRIFDRLVARYGRDAIFRDIDDVPFGVDFRTHIDQVIEASDVVLAIVGPRWLGPSESQNRISDEADPVRVEIEAALRKSRPLIPVLVLDAPMPSAPQLPEGLKDFAYRNAVTLDAGQDFDVHMSRLFRAVDSILGLPLEVARASLDDTLAVRPSPRPTKRRRLLIGGSIAAVLVTALIGGWYVGSDRRKSPSPSPTDSGEVATYVPPPPAVSPVTFPPAPPVTATARPSIDPETLFWQSISASSSTADFEEYLRKYPDGQFAGLAQNRITMLQQDIRHFLTKLTSGKLGLVQASDTELSARFQENIVLSRPDKPITAESNLCECEDSSGASYTIGSIEVLGPFDAITMFDAEYGSETKTLKLILKKQNEEWRIHDMGSKIRDSLLNLLETANNRMKREAVQSKSWYEAAQYAWARKDTNRAMKLEEDAAALGYGRALMDLGNIYYSGIQQDGIAIDRQKSIEYCRMAPVYLRIQAEAGDIEAAAALGRLLFGDGEPCAQRDRKAAYPFLLKAAEKGNRDAMFLLASILLAPSYDPRHDKPVPDNTDVAPDMGEGCRWLAKSTQAGGPISPPDYRLRRQLDEAAGSCRLPTAATIQSPNDRTAAPAKRVPPKTAASRGPQRPPAAPPATSADPFAVQKRLQESWGRQ